MEEIDVTLTDYALGLESLWFAFLISRKRATSETPGLKILFVGFALAALAGGTFHGFFNNPAQPGHDFLWWLTLSFTGVTAAGFALTGVTLLTGSPSLPARRLLLSLFLVYLVLTLRYREFSIAILFYLPALLSCVAGLTFRYIRRPNPQILLGILGLVASLPATLLQQLQIALHPVYFTHNALYHLILMGALYLFYRGISSSGVSDVSR